MPGADAGVSGGATTTPNCYSACTRDVDAPRQVEYWTEAFGAIWGRVAFSPTGARLFYGDLQSVRINSLRVNRINFEGMTFKRLQGQRQEPFYSLAFPQAGRSVVFLGSDCLELVPGAVYLLDNSRRAELLAPDTYRTSNVQIPISRLRERLGVNWHGGSIRMEHSPVVLGMLKSMVHELSQPPEEIDARGAEFLDRQICDLVAFCLSGPGSAQSEEGSLLLAHRERTDRCIERLYARADLTPGRIAAACGISESYLHKVYRGTGRTVMERVREARLQAGHDLLRRARARTTVSEIAYEVGFKSLAEFSRAYKRRFGQSPQGTRRA